MCVCVCVCVLVNVRELVEVDGGGGAGSVWPSTPHCTSNASSPSGDLFVKNTAPRACVRRAP